MTERDESLMRIVVGIVSGIILGIWWALIKLLIIVNIIITFLSGERNKDVAEFCEIWSTQFYTFVKYMTALTNERPFPFEGLKKSMSKFK